MALTDQPYLPLYVDDWMNNTKLKMCSPEAHGLMLSVMCLMHKEKRYGTILLKQKYKQTDKQVHNFAYQLARVTAFDFAEIVAPLEELIDERVLKVEGDLLFCGRMIKDAELSLKRANSGRKGGKKTTKITKEFAQAKEQANTVIVNGIENVNGIELIEKEESEKEEIPMYQKTSPGIHPKTETIAKHFSIDSHLHHTQYRMINQELNKLKEKEVDYLIQQTEFYFQYIRSKGLTQCNISTWLGWGCEPKWRSQDYKRVFQQSSKPATPERRKITRNL